MLGLPSFFFLFSLASAFPQPQWMAPGPDDVRGPCPMMNSLANHGLIPRSGRNIANHEYLEGLMKVNCGVDLASAFLTGAAVLGVPHRLDLSFGLDDLRKHRTIEHDASFSRNDCYLSSIDAEGECDNYSFNQTLYNQLRSLADEDSFLNYTSIAASRLQRQADTHNRNPNNDIGLRQGVIVHGEGAILLQFFGWQFGAIHNRVPLNYTDSIFEHERLPYDLGWTPPPLPITLAIAGAGEAAIIAEEVRLSKTLFPTGGV
ncbi:hypothetical protein HKX48_001405 [Thoreauomyces humboldtii]|nr:hypothetical protein HKX48_001405 [Thoreauomyces humboldtii]